MVHNAKTLGDAIQNVLFCGSNSIIRNVEIPKALRRTKKNIVSVNLIHLASQVRADWIGFVIPL